MNNRNEIPQQVKQVVSIAETLLQGQILGMYLYGSATMNKLRPDSDIDILIINNISRFPSAILINPIKIPSCSNPNRATY